MFESDDYDEILSQVEFLEGNKASSNNVTNLKSHENVDTNNKNATNLKVSPPTRHETFSKNDEISKKNTTNSKDAMCNNNIEGKENTTSLKHTKRKIINTYFEHKSKRKFPGPAGLLCRSYEAKKDDEAICEIELLTQDIDCTQNYLNDDVFESPIWKRLLENTKHLGERNNIKAIKHQALVGNLQKKKAQVVAAFVESVDRSAIDPLITLRDTTGSIKCTLHRDAWSAFSAYIVSEHCALVLLRPTVLTTGSAFKKHYLNITLSNINTICASVVINDDTLPEGFNKSCEEEYSIIKKDVTENSPDNETLDEEIDFLQDLENAFSEDMF